MLSIWVSVYLLFISIPIFQLVHLLTLLKEECRLRLPLHLQHPQHPKLLQLHLLLVVAIRLLLVPE